MPHLIPIRGRPSVPLAFEVVRQLTSGDLFKLSLEGGELTAVAPIQRIRETHRRRARLIAQGRPLNEVAILCDCTPARLHQLMVDPTFTNLVAYFREQIDEATVDAGIRMQERLIDVAELATAEIQDRLEDVAERKKLNIDQLRRLSESALDRTIAPPRTAVPGGPSPIAITFNIPGRGLNPQMTVEHEPAEPAVVPELAGPKDPG